MNCLEYQEWWQQRLDGTSPPADAGVPEHLAACSECRAWGAAARRLEVGLRLLTLPVPPAGLGERLAGSVLADQRRRLTVRRQFTVVLAVAASVALVALGSWLTWTRLASPQPLKENDAPVKMVEDHPVSSQPQKSEKHETPAPVEKTPSLNQSVTDLSALLTSWSRPSSEQPTEPGRSLLSVLKLPALDGFRWQQTFPSPMDPFLDAGQGFSSTVQPLTQSARRALELLRREVPLSRAEDKKG